MYKIQTLNAISDIIHTQLSADKYTVSKDEPVPDAILVRSAAMHEMEFGKELLAIGRAGAGVTHIPIDKCSKEGIVVFNTPGANANAVAELVSKDQNKSILIGWGCFYISYLHLSGNISRIC